MADGKRQNMAGRTATPKVNPSKDINDGDTVFYKAVGKRVKVTLAPDNRVVEGSVFTVCKDTKRIVINSAPAPPNPSALLSSQPGKYHIIGIQHITSFEITGPGESYPESGSGIPGALFPSISKVDLEAASAREEAAIREIQKKQAQKGKGVTKEAQALFDFITRTLPTRWAGAQIVVNDAVIIDPPYRLENVKAPQGKEQQSLIHIRKIVERYYQKNGNGNPGGNRAPVATPVAPRKGG